MFESLFCVHYDNFSLAADENTFKTRILHQTIRKSSMYRNRKVGLVKSMSKTSLKVVIVERCFYSDKGDSLGHILQFIE